MYPTSQNLTAVKMAKPKEFSYPAEACDGET